MPTFSGATDEEHTVALPSEIERVHWDRRRAAPGGQVGLTIRTRFCGAGARMDIRLEDAQGTVHDTLSGRIHGDSVTVDLQVPPEATGGLLALVEMPNHGLSAASDALRIVEPVRVRSALWSQETVQRGDRVTLSAEARRAPDGRRATVRIFERASGSGAPDPVTRLRPRTEGGAVTVTYRFQYPGDTADIRPAWDAPDGYTQPEYVYTVTVAGVRADSEPAKSNGVLTFVDDLTLQVVDPTRGAPYADQTVAVTLADGSTVEDNTNASGTVELSEIPPGPATVELPALGAPAEAPVEAPDGARRVVAPPSPGGPPTADVATGSAWRLVPARIPFPVSA
jgi:hypothetical protein